MSDVVTQIATAAGEVLANAPEVAAAGASIAKDVSGLAGQNGTDLGTRLGALEDLVSTIHGMLAHLFPAHFKG